MNTSDIAHEIVDGTLRHGRIDLAYVLDQTLDEPLLDSEDVARLISGDTETRMDILSRAEQAATAVVNTWLQSREGQTFLDEIKRQERENVESELNDELDDLIYDARNNRDTAFPATLRCGCKCDLESESDGDSVWTNRVWDLCEKHQGLKP